MTVEQVIHVDLDDGTSMAVVVEPVGGALVSEEEVIAKLGSVSGSVETVSRSMLDAVKRVGPDRATVELSFGLALEAGKLVALFGKAKGEASITVTLGWGKEG